MLLFRPTSSSSHLRRLPSGGAHVYASLLLPHQQHQLQQRATFVEAKVRWVRDRGLDHAIEKEKHLRPLHSLKDLLLCGPISDSAAIPFPPLSLPLSSISEKRHDLALPFRPISFIRKYPSAFIEDLPSPPPSSPSAASSSFQLRIRPTPELIRLHEEELSIYESCRSESADRLLRLLMLTRRKRLPLPVVDRLRWDLGLPRDYVRSLLPGFPDYFQIVPSSSDDGAGHLDLELVCWNKDLAVSVMERAAGGAYSKGMPLAFPLNFSRDSKLEKKVKKWMEEWQKLPYISPYEDSTHHDPSTPIAEKWTVGVLHELLHLLIPKNTEKENLLLLGEHVGLHPGFKKVLVNYPGIFYVSNKNMSQTVVIRDGYKRDHLIEKHPLMGMRYQYIHLMHRVAEHEAAAARTRKKHGKKSVRMESGVNKGDAEVHEEVDDYDEDEDDDDDDDSSMSMSSDSETEEESEEEVDDKVRAHERKQMTTTKPVGTNRSSVELSSIERQLRTRKVFRSFPKKQSSRGSSVGARSPGKNAQPRTNKKALTGVKT